MGITPYEYRRNIKRFVPNKNALWDRENA